MIGSCTGCRKTINPALFRCDKCHTLKYGRLSEFNEKSYPLHMAPSLPACGMVDEFGFPLLKKEEISVEDLALVRGFLGNLRDSTLSRSTHRVLQDLLQRL